jgi:hypothetical protein
VHCSSIRQRLHHECSLRFPIHRNGMKRVMSQCLRKPRYPSMYSRSHHQPSCKKSYHHNPSDDKLPLYLHPPSYRCRQCPMCHCIESPDDNNHLIGMQQLEEAWLARRWSHRMIQGRHIFPNRHIRNRISIADNTMYYRVLVRNKRIRNHNRMFVVCRWCSV